MTWEMTTIILTLLGLIYTISHFKTQLKLNFFAEYTKRYQEIILHLPLNIFDENFNFDNLDDIEKNQTLKYLRAYFDLCSEEYYLWTKKYIDQGIWEEWESGIKFTFKKPAFKKAWQELRINTLYPGEFTEFIDKSDWNKK